MAWAIANREDVTLLVEFLKVIEKEQVLYNSTGL